jgi:AcrR family transcriptional regulator
MEKQPEKEESTNPKREQILNAALTVFSKKGYGEATIPDIAQEAGVAVGTIYNYYQGKRHLLISLIETFVITEPFKKLIEHPPEADDVAFFSSMIEERLEFGTGNLDRFFFLFGEIQRNPELRQQYVEQVLHPIMKYIEDYLNSRVDSGAFRPVNTAVMSRLLPAMVIGLVLMFHIEGENSPLCGIPRQELVNEMLNFVLGGLLKKDS